MKILLTSSKIKRHTFYLLPLFVILLSPVYSLAQNIVGSTLIKNNFSNLELIIVGGIGIQTFDPYTYEIDIESKDQEIENSTLLAYPNPTNNVISFYRKDHEYSIHKIEVFDVSGSKVKIITMKEWKDNQSLDVATLPSGIYFLKLYYLDNSEISTLSFIKQ